MRYFIKMWSPDGSLFHNWGFRIYVFVVSIFSFSFISS